MKKNEISPLLQRYLSAQEEEKEPYFDASEIEELLSSFEEMADYDYYEEILNLGQRLHPSSSNLQLKRCHWLIIETQYEEALALVQTITDADGMEYDQVLLECYASLNNYPKVFDLIEERTEEDSDYLEPLIEFTATLLNDLEMIIQANDMIEYGLERFPDNILLLNELCYVRQMEENLPEAIRICNQLIDKDPYSYDYWFTLGKLYAESEDYEKAIEALDFAATCGEPYSNELNLLKGFCLYMNESYHKALEAYLEMKDTELTWKMIQPLLAECYMKLEEYEEAYRIYKKIIENGKSQVNIVLELRKNFPLSSLFMSYLRCCLLTDREQEVFQQLRTAGLTLSYKSRYVSLLILYFRENSAQQDVIKLIDALAQSYDHDENLFLILHTGIEEFGKIMFEPDVCKAYEEAEFDNKNEVRSIANEAVVAFLNDNREFFKEAYDALQNDQEQEVFFQLLCEAFSKSFVQSLAVPDPARNILPELTGEFLRNKENSN